MTRLALRNPLAVLMVSIALMVFSAVVTPRMAVDTFPELNPPVLIVGTLASGLGPKDVEKTITWRLEKVIAATPGVDHIRSKSLTSLSIVYVWLKWGTDLNAAQALVQQQVAFAMSSVPKTLGVLPPFVLQYDPTEAPVLQIAIHGGGLSGPQLYDFAVNSVEPIIEGIPGVASASPNGGRERRINIVVDPVRALARGVTSSEIAAAVDKANALLPSGRLMTTGSESNVYTNAVAWRVSDIGDAVVKQVDGHPVLIRDVALVEDGGSAPSQFVAVDGNPAVYLNVLRIPGANTVQVVESIREALANLKGMPPGIVVQPIFDQATFVRGAIKGLQREIVQALFLVAGVILLFLQSVRSVLIAAISVPLSFATILLVLYATDQSLNAFTLGGLTLAMGPLVDISVVVLESIHQRRSNGEDAVTAALRGAKAVAAPALAASLCTIAVLLPVVLLTGLAKKLFSPLALTVATAMFAGYFVSMLITPVACRYLLGGHQEPGKLASAVSRVIDRVVDAYTNALRAALDRRIAVVATIFALVAASGYAASWLPAAFFPEVDESMERVYVRLAPGTSLTESTRIFQEIGQTLRQELPKNEVELILMNIGSPSKARSKMNSPNAGPHMGFLRVALAPPEKRQRSQREIADAMRSILTRRFPGVDFLQTPGGLVASVFSNGYRAPLTLEVHGEDLDELNAASKAIVEVAREIPGVRDIYTTFDLDYPELRINTDRQQAGLVGVTARDTAQTTLEATVGNINTPAVWVDDSNGQSYYVVTAYDPRIIEDSNRLREVPIRATQSGAITLGSYATIERSTGPISIERNHLQRVALVYMQTEGRDLGSTATELEQRLHDDPRTHDVHFSLVGQVDLMRTTFSSLGVALVLAILVVFVIMTIQFKSMRLPFIMLFTIPACIVGIVAALFAAGEGFSVPTMMGILMVVGIAVSNGILLVDHANKEFAAGKDVLEAVIEAGRARFRPIAMTSLATIISLLPTALGLEHGTESNRPLALAVTGGLASSTLLALFLVPVMFVFLAKRTPEIVVPEA